MKKNQPVLFDVVEKIEQSTTSITELRIPIFAPVQKLSGNSTTAKEFKKNGGIRTIATSWGKVEIRGRALLTQVHRDLLDCIYTHATRINRAGDNEVTILFSQTKILREYKSGKSNSWETQTKWLKNKIKEIRDITINYENTKGDSFDFNLISNLDYSDEYNSYAITLDKRYLKFYERELSINYKRELPKLLQVESASIKAVIRWFFTHKNESKYKLLTVLEALGFPIDSPKTLQTTKRDFKLNVNTFRSFGIDYDPKEEMFSYRGNPNIGFIPSLFNDNKSVTQKKKNVEVKKINIYSFIGKSIYLENKDKEVIIKNIIFSTKGALVSFVLIETGNGIEFKISNVNEHSKDIFEQESIEYLNTLLIK